MKHRIILLIVIAPTVCGALLGLMWCLTMPINANAKTAEASLLNVQGTPTVDPTVAALQKDQLIQEVTGLETDNAWYWVIWIKLSPSLTVLVGIVIGFWSLFRWLRDRRDEQKRREEDLQGPGPALQGGGAGRQGARDPRGQEPVALRHRDPRVPDGRSQSGGPGGRAVQPL